MTEKLTLSPDTSGYSITDGKQAIRQQLDGGRGRYRQDIANPAISVKCKWILNQVKYEYMRRFYHTTYGGALPFTIDLLLDDGTVLTEVTANFIPGKFRVNNVKGTSYVVTAELEIEPPEQDEQTNTSYVTLYNAYGDDSQAFINALNQLVNVTMPAEI
jgi:hypothetical protein